MQDLTLPQQRAARRLVVLVVALRRPPGRCGSPARALDARVDPADTKLLTQPAVSASQLAFIYGGDLFVADLGAATSATCAG